MAEKPNGYVGQISQNGTQMVKAPNQKVVKKGGKVKKGTDLRSGS